MYHVYAIIDGCFFPVLEGWIPSWVNLQWESVVDQENEWRRKENKQHLGTGGRVKGDKKGYVEEFMQARLLKIK